MDTNFNIHPESTLGKDEKAKSNANDSQSGYILDKLESSDNSIDISLDETNQKINLKISSLGLKDYQYLVDVYSGGDT